MVGHTDAVCPDVLTELLKIAVTQFPRSHLDTDFMEGSIFSGVEVGTMQGDVVSLTKLGDKTLIAIGLFPTKVEIAMGRLDAIA
jgi:hypothetical protein